MILKDKVAILTGAGQGIGKVYALRLAQEGAKVVIAEINPQWAEQAAQEVRAQGGEALALATDVASVEATEAMARRTTEAFGRIDILVNNAALFVALLPHKPFYEIDPQEWDRVMAVNVKGPFLCVRAVFPYMRAQGRGKIINISSGTVQRGTPGYLHYVSSKGAVEAFTRALAREVGQYGITVNAIAPGLTASEGVLAKYSAEYIEGRNAQRSIPRTQVPQDLAGTVVFLASEDSDFITGQTIAVDGGTVFR